MEEAVAIFSLSCLRHHGHLNLGGVNQFGERFGLHLLDPLAGGSSAFATHDGNAGGPVAAPVPSIADVEPNEQVSLFYLYRRLQQAMAGAGARRGGNARRWR